MLKLLTLASIVFPITGLAQGEALVISNFDNTPLSNVTSVRGIVGNGFRLGENVVVTQKLQIPIDYKKGTLSLWTRSVSKNSENERHIIVALGWSGTEPGNLSLVESRDGNGNDSLQLMINDRIGCSSTYEANSDQWHHIAVTWRKKKQTLCKVFIDGKLISNNKSVHFPKFLAKHALNITSGNGNVELDEILIYPFSVSDKEIKRLHRSQEGSTELLSKTDRQWAASWYKNNFLASSLNPQTHDIRERRVLFDPDIYWATSEYAVDEIVEFVKEAGFNTLVAAVWQGRGTRFPSNFAPWEPRLKARMEKGWDPLSYLIEKAHAEGIEVHAWFNVVQRRLQFLDQYYDQNTPKNAFNVHDKNFRGFIVSLIQEVVTRYNLDGINLDHIRSMGFCGSQLCKEDYFSKYHRDLKKDIMLKKISRASFKTLSTWNYEAVTDIVRRISTKARRLRPNLVLSVDAHPLDNKLLIQGQDSIEWVNQGLIDVIFDMRYQQHPDFSQAVQASKALNSPEKLTILFSTYTVRTTLANPWPSELIKDYISISRKLLPESGVAFYNRQRLTGRHRTKLRDTVFKDFVSAQWPR